MGDKNNNKNSSFSQRKKKSTNIFSPETAIKQLRNVKSDSIVIHCKNTRSDRIQWLVVFFLWYITHNPSLVSGRMIGRIFLQLQPRLPLMKV